MARQITTSTATGRASRGARGTQAPPAGETVAATLAAHPGRTAAELAQLAGLGTSTVAKALAALETVGLACRHIPEATGDRSRRSAAHWQPVPTTPPADAEPAEARPEPESAARTTGENARSGDGTAPGRTERLGKGELGTLVLEYLIARAGDDLGPTAVGKALDRSQGAVANCLTKLATSGDIVQTSDQPLRYRLAS